MGDFTKNGTKIGTCGKAYYATYHAILNHTDNNGEIEHYRNLRRYNSFSYAFPFPAFDGKKVGEITQFHLESQQSSIVGKQLYPIYLSNEDAKDIHHSKIRIRINDIYKDEDKESAICFCHNSANKYYMEYTSFINGTPSILIYCAFCGSGTHFTMDEGKNENEITGAIIENIESSEDEQKPYHEEILKRVLEWYKLPTGRDFENNPKSSDTLNSLYKNLYI